MTQLFQLGDTVEWPSQANGGVKTKRGRIVVIIPASQAPYQVMLASWCEIYNCAAIDPRMLPRATESYIVKVAQRGKAKPRLYWPRVSALRRVSEAK